MPKQTEVYGELPPKGGGSPQREELAQYLEVARGEPGSWVVIWENGEDANEAAKKAQSFRELRLGKEQGEKWKFASRTMPPISDMDPRPKRHVVLARVEFQVNGE